MGPESGSSSSISLYLGSPLSPLKRGSFLRIFQTRFFNRQDRTIHSGAENRPIKDQKKAREQNHGLCIKILIMLFLNKLFQCRFNPIIGSYVKDPTGIFIQLKGCSPIFNIKIIHDLPK